MPTLPRLFVAAALHADGAFAPDPAQLHYLTRVMRRRPGDRVLLFNGRDGEWSGRLSAGQLVPEIRTRPQPPDGDLWLLFAPLKRERTEWLVEKATELGVSDLVPVATDRTQPHRLAPDRLRQIAIEAAEQSERLTVPRLHGIRPLREAMAAWPADRALVAALERLAGDATPVPAADIPRALLVGPEGGFTEAETGALAAHPQAHRLSLGRRIMRAETAALAGLTLLELTPPAP